MKFRMLVRFLVVMVLFIPIAGFAQSKLTEPPIKFTKEQIQTWMDAEVATINPALPATLYETEEWQDYINEHHFVPLTLEGVPDGYKFDFNWVENETPRRGLPTAEVIETGEFIFWWNKCNYYDLSEDACKKFINLVTTHENIHYSQWQRIAINVLTALGQKISTDKLPTKISDLEAVTGGKEAFMRIWADGGHYQCREVEAYVRQIENKEISEEILGKEGFLARVNNLYNYTYGSEYSEGCACSIWALEFSEYIQSILRERTSFLRKTISSRNSTKSPL